METGEIKESEVKVRRSVWPQHLAALSATLSAFSGGIALGWSTPIVPYLQEDGREYIISDEEGSWLGSLPNLGAFLGAIPAGYVASLIGRKNTLLILAVPYIASLIMMIFAENNFALLCVARFISGIGLGATVVITPVYNEEISDIKARGITGTYCEINLCLGVLFSFAVGAYASYVWYHIGSILIEVAFFCTFVLMPESPLYLLMKNLDDEAEKSLRWLRGAGKGNDVGIDEEMKHMKIYLEENMVQRQSNTPRDPFLKRFKQTLMEFSPRTPTGKASIISLGLLIFQQLNGNNALLFYTVDFFKDAGISISPYAASTLPAVAQLLSACVSSRILNFTGRKPVLLFSEIWYIILIIGLCIYFGFKESGTDVSSVAWIPILIMILYALLGEVGFGPTPWLVMAEVSPPETKYIITSSAGCIYWLLVFLITKLYTDMVSLMGIAWTFGFYGFCSGIGLPFIIFVVPETKGKSREEIQHELRYGRKTV